MSKVDAQRAMREARWAERQKGAVAVSRPAPVKAAATTAVAAKPVRSAAATRPADTTHSEEPTAAPELCGHRSMNNKSCRRPAGHSEKNHRYT